MSEINVLDKAVSELIAAGEVIERPSSVIKELVENSIDAGASHVTVEIKNGGTTYMRVSDDGCGMTFEDVPKAFLRHATSKISDKADLDTIMTLGFRGEALASVSAVGRVEVMTKRQNEDYGTLYKIEGSIETSYEKCGCPDGTTIIVRDLFFNVPARRKFMKKDVTEANAVSQILQKITMSHPEVSFKLIRDNRIEFNSSGDGELYSAVYAVYGRDFAHDLISVDYIHEKVHVKGYVLKPLYSRKNRTFQNFFVNGRYVRSKLCSAAVESALENMIMTGKFPGCVLMLELEPGSLDVNIHPAKAEVRFTDEKRVSDAIYFSVKNALCGNGLLYEFEFSKKNPDWTKMPAEEPEQPLQQEIMFTPVEQIPAQEERIKSMEQQSEHHNFSEPSIIEKTPETVIKTIPESASEKHQPVLTEPEQIPEPVMHAEEGEPVQEFKYINSNSFSEPAAAPVSNPEPEKNEPPIHVIGEAFKNYIMAEAGDKIIMIDKHAAHERIIFERLKSRNCRQYSQLLIDTSEVLLPVNEFDALESNRELLSDMGFEFDFSKKPCVVTKAVPTFMTELDLDEIIPEIAENLCLGKQNPQTHILDDMLHTLACKSAIKANDKNDIRELQSLAEQVYNDERIRHCPHGRPVMFTMSKGSIEHQFRRS